MTKEKDAYSLTELCEDLDLSPSWVKKIEHYLGLSSWGSGQRGKRSFYSGHQFEFFRKIAVLRFLGYGLEEIKTVFDNEMDILNTIMEHFPMEDVAEGEEDRYSPVPLYLLSNVYCGSHGVMRDNKKYQEYEDQKMEEAITLDKALSDYKTFLSAVVKVFRHKQKYMKNELKMLEEAI